MKLDKPKLCKQFHNQQKHSNPHKQPMKHLEQCSKMDNEHIINLHNEIFSINNNNKNYRGNDDDKNEVNTKENTF